MRILLIIISILEGLLLFCGKTFSNKTYAQGVDTTYRIIRAYIRKGDSLFRKGSVVEATLCYRKAFELNPRDPVIAQRLADGLKASKRGLRQLERLAYVAYRERDLLQAAKHYKNILAFDSSHFNAKYRLGKIHWFQGHIDSCIYYYNRALSTGTHNDTIYFDYGLALKKQGRYEEAIAKFEEFLQKIIPKKLGYSIYREQAEKEIEGSKLGMALRNQNTRVLTKNLVLNSELSEYQVVLWPRPKVQSTKGFKKDSLYVGDTIAVFTAHRLENKGQGIYPFNGEPFSDLWMATYENGEIGGEMLFSKQLQTYNNEGNATFSPDGSIIYYTVCGRGRKTPAWGCAIYYAEFDTLKQAWKKGRKVKNINGRIQEIVNLKGKKKFVASYDAQPALAENGKILYFVSDRKGGYGGTDIWFSRLTPKGWSEPQNAGPKINTPFDEIFPYYIDSLQTLYFASMGHMGMGGFDIFKAKGNQKKWESPQPLPYPFNTSYHDYTITWQKVDSAGWVSSDRPWALGNWGNEKSKGRDDIWWVAFLPPPLPTKVEVPKDTIFSLPVVEHPKRAEDKILIYGLIRGNDTQQGIVGATVNLYRLDIDGNLAKIKTAITQADGRYEFELDTSIQYYIMAGAPRYVPNDIKVHGRELKVNKNNEVIIDLFLPKAVVGTPYALSNIYYDFDKAEIRKEAYPALERIRLLLETNPTYKIQLAAHTDSRGSEYYNLKLSERRAQAVVEYLKQKGVSADKLEAKGYGETQLAIKPERSEKDMQANRRTEFRILSFE
ncbi:MAG: OmpA family protein [Bacteroidia bacterium]|nr:OmpA family protein [Bacteroidia bacterium]